MRGSGRRPGSAASLAILAAVSTSVALSLQLLLGGGGLASVVEPDTGVAFPDALGKQSLVATGVRRKFGAVKVYAVGFYLDRASKLYGKGPSADQLLKAAPGFASVRIVITSRLVNAAKLSSALTESVWPRLKGLKAAEAEQVMKDFEAAFLEGPALKPGTAIVLKLGKPGIEVEVGKRYKASVKSPALVKAFLATYVDANGVIPEFRDAIFEALKIK